MKRLWFILFLIFIGCATTTQNLPKPNRDILNKGNVRIKLTRSSEYYGAGLGFTVYDNGNLVGKLGSGGVFVWDRPEGKVTLSRDWNFSRGSVANNSISFRAEKGYGYEIYVSYTGGFSTSPYIGDPNAGREVLQRLLNIYQENQQESSTTIPRFQKKYCKFDNSTLIANSKTKYGNNMTVYRLYICPGDNSHQFWLED